MRCKLYTLVGTYNTKLNLCSLSHFSSSVCVQYNTWNVYYTERKPKNLCIWSVCALYLLAVFYDHSTIHIYRHCEYRACEKRNGTVQLTCAELCKNLFHCYYRCGIHSSRLELKLCMLICTIMQSYRHIFQY